MATANREIGVPRRAYVWVAEAYGFAREDGQLIVSGQLLARMDSVAAAWGGPTTLVVRQGRDEHPIPADAVTVEPDGLPFGLFVADFADDYAVASSVVDAGMVLISAKEERLRIATLCRRLSVAFTTDPKTVRQAAEAA